MIKTTQLVKRFGDKVAVNDVNLDVKGGEIFGFLGPNGAGKTTTIKMVSGLLRPTSGQAFVGGFDLAPVIRALAPVPVIFGEAAR